MSVVTTRPETQNHDPVSIEIIQNSLRALTDEMFATMQKTAMSSIIYEVLDFGVSLMDRNGQLACAGAGIPGFVGMLSPCVNAVINKFNKPGDINPGDLFISNIPHYGAASHLNDVVLVLPAFEGDVLVGWLANKAHWIDIGGAVPGSVSLNSATLYQEGLQIPCVKIIEAGQTNAALLEVIACNSRTSEVLTGDFWAGVSSLRSGEKRLLSLVKKYGLDTVLYAIDNYIDLGERKIRAAMENLPRGSYEASEFLTDDLEIKARITIDANFTVDLRGNPPQQGNSFNSTYDATMIAVQMIFKALTQPDLFANAGSFRPLRLLVDEDSMFNAKYPSATGVYYEVGVALFDLLWKALAPAGKMRLTAGHYASVCGTFLSGKNPHSGRIQSIIEPQLGGWGACSDRDGQSALYTGYHGDTLNVPVEVAEQRNGVLIDQLCLNDCGGGEGKYTGGKGIKLDYRIIGDGWSLTMAYGKSTVKPWSIDGGRPGSNNYVDIVRSRGAVERYSSCTELPLERGDVVRVITANGGGYGDPAERPKEAVLEDLKNGYINEQQARDIYGISL